MQPVRSIDSDRRRWQLGAFGLIMLGMLATAVHGAELAPTVGLQLKPEQETTFNSGDTLSLSASADPQGVPVDVYVALLLPTGDLLFLTPDGFTTTPQSITATLAPDGLTDAASGDIFSYTLTGAEPLGQYIWLAVLTAHGTTELVSDVAQAPFTVE